MIVHSPSLSPSSGEDFALFPFTSPVPKGKSCRERKGTPPPPPRSKEEIRSPGRFAIPRRRTPRKPHRSVMNEWTVHDSRNVPNVDLPVKEQTFLFADFESMGFANAVRDEERWDAFGDTSPAELSLVSTKVQLGQAEVYDSAIEHLDCFKAGALHDSVDESVLGPFPLADASPEDAHAPDGSKAEPGVPERASRGYILMLATNMGMNRTQVQNQQRATMMLNALSIPFESIDGSDPENKELRNELFQLSDMRGVYPQFFVVVDDDGVPKTTFLGDWETIEGINDSSSLPAEILDANPTLLTWERIPGLSYQKVYK